MKQIWLKMWKLLGFGTETQLYCDGNFFFGFLLLLLVPMFCCVYAYVLWFQWNRFFRKSLRLSTLVISFWDQCDGFSAVLMIKLYSKTVNSMHSAYFTFFFSSFPVLHATNNSHNRDVIACKKNSTTKCQSNEELSFLKY